MLSIFVGVLLSIPSILHYSKLINNGNKLTFNYDSSYWSNVLKTFKFYSVIND